MILAFALFVLAALALGGFAYRTAVRRAAEAEAEAVARSMQDRLVDAEREWGEEAARRARDVAAVASSTPDVARWDLVARRLSDFPLATGFRHLFVLSSSGAALFHLGPNDIAPRLIEAATDRSWVYAPAARTLFRSYPVRVSLAGESVTLLFLRAIDDSVFPGGGRPGLSFQLVWEGRPVAASGGAAGAPAPDDDWVERRTPWSRSEPTTPILVVRSRPAALFSPGEIAVGIAGGALALLGLLHLALGAWVLVTARRVSSLAALARELLERRVPGAGRGAASREAAVGDDIDEAAQLLQALRDAAIQRDAERASRERALRESEEKVRETTASLRESEERGRVLFNGTGDAAFVFGLSPDAGQEPRFLDVNDAACRRLGYRREELLRMGSAEVEWGGTSEQRDEAIREIREKGEACFERVYLCKDGRRVPVQVSAHLMERGGQLAVLAVARDVSERKQAEAEYRSIVQTSVDGFWVASASDGRLLDVNPAYGKMTGYTVDELLAMRIADLEARESPEQAARHLRDIVEGRRERFETRHRRRDGSEFDVEVSAKYVAGRGVVIAFVRDTRERKQAEQRMADLLELNRTIIEQSTLGILVFKASGACVLANDAAATIVGESAETLLGQDFRGIRAWQGSGLAEAADTALGTGANRHVEVQATTTGGRQVSLECDLVPFSSGGEPHLLVIASDVTAERAAEHALREATRLAEAASLAKTEFLANMSHEIRTPMNAIIGLTHLVLDTDLSPRQHDYLRKIQAASRALLGILNAILDYSKIESGRLEVESIPFSIDQVVQVVSDLFSARADEKGLFLAFDVAPGLPGRFVGDPLRLGQVLTNLVGNGLKFTERGGVRVSVSMGDRDGDTAILRFSVADTGIGLSAAEGQRLFQAFTQADTSITRRYGGAGLGLAISKRLVEMMGGEIGFESEPGQGSIFHFTARVRLAPAAEAGELPAEGGRDERAPAAGARVLLAEDNEINLMVAKVFLENAGLIVRPARDGREAVALAEAERFDVILMDLQMPEMDGLEATRAIRAQAWGRDVPIVAMTAAAMEEDRVACLAAGMSDHVSKPIAPAELLRVLAKWVGPEAVRVASIEERPVRAVEGLPVALPGFDLPAALARMGTDAERLAAVLWRFARDFADTAAEMTRLVAAGETESAARVAHRVKGTAGTVGATDLEAAAAQIERELKSGAGPVSLAAFVHAMCSALDLIAAHVPRPGATPEHATASFDPAALAPALGRLARVLDEHDLVPESLLEEVCGQLTRTPAARLGDALRNEVESFDYARALQTLDAIVSSLDLEMDGRHA